MYNLIEFFAKILISVMERRTSKKNRFLLKKRNRVFVDFAFPDKVIKKFVAFREHLLD